LEGYLVFADLLVTMRNYFTAALCKKARRLSKTRKPTLQGGGKIWCVNGPEHLLHSPVLEGSRST